MEYTEVYKRWAARELEIDPEQIQSVYFSIDSGTCGYGTCEWREIDAQIWTKKGKLKTFTYSDPVDLINSILKFTAEEPVTTGS